MQGPDWVFGASRPSGYTGGVRQNSPRPQLALLAVALIGALCLGACAEAWRTPVAPTPTPDNAAAASTPPAVAKPTPKPAAPGQDPAKPTPKPTAKQLHEVRTGDNLYSVARQHGVSVEDLRRWNGLDKESVIKVGQKLIIQK